MSKLRGDGERERGERVESDEKRQRREEEGETVKWTHQSSSLCVHSSVRLAGVLLTLPACANYTYTHTRPDTHTQTSLKCAACDRVCFWVCCAGSVSMVTASARGPEPLKPKGAPQRVLSGRRAGIHYKSIPDCENV